MTAAPGVAVLDACVLFAMPVCDTLLHAATAGLYQIRWSHEILDEAHRNLVSRLGMDPARAARRKAAMLGAFEDALVEGYEHLIPAMPNHPKDRHVAAVAVVGEATAIVTANLRDFATLPPGIAAWHPDDFLLALHDAEPDAMLEVLHAQVAVLVKPPTSIEQMLTRLTRSAPTFVTRVRDGLR